MIRRDIYLHYLQFYIHLYSSLLPDPALPGQVVAPAAASVAAIVAPPPSVLRQRAGRHAPQQQQARDQGADEHGRQLHPEPELETDRRQRRQTAFYDIACLEQVMSCRAFNTSNNWLSSCISVFPSYSGSRRRHCAESLLVTYPLIVTRVHLDLYTLTHYYFYIDHSLIVIL